MIRHLESNLEAGAFGSNLGIFRYLAWISHCGQTCQGWKKPTIDPPDTTEYGAERAENHKPGLQASIWELTGIPRTDNCWL